MSSLSSSSPQTTAAHSSATSEPSCMDVDSASPCTLGPLVDMTVAQMRTPAAASAAAVPPAVSAQYVFSGGGGGGGGGGDRRVHTPSAVALPFREAASSPAAASSQLPHGLHHIRRRDRRFSKPDIDRIKPHCLSPRLTISPNSNSIRTSSVLSIWC